MADTTLELVWLQQLLYELGFGFGSPMRLYWEIKQPTISKQFCVSWENKAYRGRLSHYSISSCGDEEH